MGTLGIIQQMLVHIQGEANPIYIAERRMDQADQSLLPGVGLFMQWGRVVFWLALLAVPIAALLESQIGQRLSLMRDAFINVAIVLTGSVLSLGWTLPLTLLAGRGISRERAAKTWDALVVTPYPTETILLAKAAASVSLVWRLVLTFTFVASIPGLFLGGPLVLALLLGTQPALLTIASITVGTIAIVIEREQEVALSITMGIAAAFVGDSRRTTLFLGLVGGLLIRLVQALATLMLVVSIAPFTLPYFAVLNAVAGSSTVLAADPALASLAFVVGSVVLREGLIRVLFGWTVRRAHEG